MEIHFAPLQGYTDLVYRKAYQNVFGGVDFYYTPFIRMDNNGSIRRKDVKDIQQDRNDLALTVPQILAGSAHEMKALMRALEMNNYRHADLNLGCPFPMVVKSRRGSGLLDHPDIIKEILGEIANFPDIKVSVKIRLGLHSANEAMHLLPVFETHGIHHVTVHARTTVQQYKGKPDMEHFRELYENCRVPILYNGDLNCLADIHSIQEQFPHLKGVMIGRGLLQDPFMAREYAGVAFSQQEKYTMLEAFHEEIFNLTTQRLSGDAHVLIKMKTLWDYLLPELPRKERKQIIKSKTIEKYSEAVLCALENWVRQ